MADLSIAIQHTPAHRGAAGMGQGDGQAQIRREDANIPLAVVEDKKREGSWPTFLRTLQATSGATHHLVLNDDLALCKDFVSSVRRVIRARPFQPCSRSTLIREWRSPHGAQRESWIQNSGVEGAAVVWPRALIAEFVSVAKVFHVRPNWCY